MKYFCVWMAMLLAFCFPAASAETIAIPAGVTKIAAEAFENCSGLTQVELPDGLIAIGQSAFANCAELRRIRIPASVTVIAGNAFSGTAPAMLVQTTAGSTAMQYAAANSLDYQADTTYRALLIAQSEYVSASKLYGTLTDVQTMSAMLSSFEETPYQVTVAKNLTGAGITQTILQTFADAKEQDVSLVYYSGHGSADGGALCGVDYPAMVSATALRECLDQIPGRKIVIVDACYSGALIGRSVETGTSADSFVDSFLSAFTIRTRSNLAADQYYVMTAAHSSEISVELQNGSRSYGLFTTYLAKGCGYDFFSSSAAEALADANGDGVLAFDEAFQYAKAQTLINAQKYSINQNSQVWPADCDWFGFLR